MTASVRWGTALHPGRVRTVNQDALLAEPPLFVVADGMGGHAAGDVASLLTLSTLHEAMVGTEPTRETVVEAIAAANEAVLGQSDADIALRGMGTTLTGVVVLRKGDDQVAMILNVGDSRTYVLHDNRLEQVTRDHSYVEELVALGELTPEQARVHPHRNVVTRAVGIEADMTVDVWERPLTVGERYLVCSDGLVNEVDDPTIAEILRASTDPQAAADELLALANEFGGRDNIAIIVVDVVDESAEPALGGWLDDDPSEFDDPGAPSATTVLPSTTVTPAASAGVPPRQRRHIVTGRAIAFLTAIVVVFMVAFFAIAVYARSGYQTCFSADDRVALCQGHAVLWFQPTVETVYPLTRNELTEEWQTRIESGIPVDSRAEADRLYAKLASDPGAVPGLTSTAFTTTTLPPATTLPVTTTTAPATSAPPTTLPPATTLPLPTVPPDTTVAPGP